MIKQFEPKIKLKYIYSVVKQLLSGFIGNGNAIINFESKLKTLFSNIIFTDVEVISTTSGTVALMMAIKALNLQKDSTILFPAYTFLAGANAARFLGYKVELIDINENTLTMNYKKIKLHKNISAIIYVHHNGYNVKDEENCSKIAKICNENKIKLIQDAAQCIGCMPPFFGDLMTLSFSVPKLITTGQGGAVVIHEKDSIIKADNLLNPNLYFRLLQIRDHGYNWKKDKIHNYLGVNFKFNDILASLGLAQLNNIGNIIRNKIYIYLYYKNNGLNLSGDAYSWMFTYRAKNKTIANEIIKTLEENDIETVRYYRPINHNIPYKTKNNFPVAEKIYDTLIYLPSSLTLRKKDVKRICSIIKNTESTNAL